MALALLAALAMAGCQGERPPLWATESYGSTQSTLINGGTTLIVDRTIEPYSLPAFSLRLGGFSGFYYPYPAFGCCPWTGTAVIPGRPRVGWRAPLIPHQRARAPVVIPRKPRPGWHAPPSKPLGIHPMRPPLAIGR
jgi:hypothetical protein